MQATKNALLGAENICFSYNGHWVLESVNLALYPGELVALLGPNGSGKTTLLKLLCGILSPQRGRCTWDARPLDSFDRRELARRIGLVPQELIVPFDLSVSEIVGLGRTPHLRPIIGETRADRDAIGRALDLTETRGLAGRFFSDLSGGERQRVVVAMALAQVAPSISPAADVAGKNQVQQAVLLLDEPTVHLDISHQIEVLELLRRLNRDFGLTVLATMHDLNLASLYFDRMILLNRGSIITEGSPREVLSKESVETVFRTEVMVAEHPTRADAPQIVLLPRNGNGGGKDWRRNE